MSELAEIIERADAARSRADKEMSKYVRTGRISGEALAAVHRAMAELRAHLKEAATLVATAHD